MIYVPVPEPLADELYDRLVAYYADDPNVQVIVDRRRSERRARGAKAPDDQQRTIRDRRRARVPGEFPAIDSGSA
jgi:hypothetical protein